LQQRFRCQSFQRGHQRNVSKLAVLSAFALTGVSALALPAGAATLGIDFTGTPVSSTNSAPIGSAYTVSLLDTAVSLDITGLGVFDNGSTANIDNNINNPGHTDTIYIGSGTAPTSSNSFGGSSLASVTISNSTATQVGYWAFGSISPLLLGPGSYWIAVIYQDPNDTVYSSSPVATQSGVTITSSAFCDQSSGCSSESPGHFGPNFEDVTATPLPAALPLFAGGLGMVGFLARRKKRNARAAA
jgi:hypothetical protein